MKTLVFKSKAVPKPWKGINFTNVKDQTVPDLSMSLHEILHRFTRGEALPVSQPHDFHDDYEDIDLNKLQHADLVEKHEFVDSLEKVKAKYEREEKIRAQKKAKDIAAAAKAEEDARILKAAEKLNQEKKNG